MMFKLIQDTLANYAPSDEPAEMRETAYRLLSRQFLYRGDHGQGEHYDRVVRHQDHYRGVAHLVGMRLVVSQAEELVGVINDLEGIRPFVKVDDAVLLLLLRHLYDERAKSFALTDQMCAPVTSLELEVELQNAVGRDLAARKTQFRTLMAPFEARGLVQVGGDAGDGESIEVLIRPAIKHVVDGNYAALLKSYCRSQQNTEPALPAAQEATPR